MKAILQFLNPWSPSRVAKRQEKDCSKGRHYIVRNVIRTRSWYVDIIEYRCAQCGFLKEETTKINYD